MARLSSCSRPGGRCYGVVALLLAVFCLARTGEAFLFAARPGASTSSSSSSMAQRITGLTRRASSVRVVCGVVLDGCGLLECLVIGFDRGNPALLRL
jgi:hypothetical protein